VGAQLGGWIGRRSWEDLQEVDRDVLDVELSRVVQWIVADGGQR